MNPLLVVIPTSADDAPRAEQLLDFIYQLNGRQQKGHVLMAYAHDLHAEFRLKLKICAELAFESVTEFQATSRSESNGAAKPIELKTKTEFTNNLWNQTARFVAGHFRWPWLWCEPDCVPITPDWIEKLADAYATQPKKFMGSRMKRMTGEAENFFMARCGVYPTSAYAELKGFIGSPPFEWASGPHVDARATKTKLIQQLNYDGDFSKVKPEAVLLHGDKTGKLIEKLREQRVRSNGHGKWESGLGDVKRVPGVESPFPEGEPSVMNLIERFDVPSTTEKVEDQEPSDKRTKAWKEWKKRQKVTA